MTTDLHMVEGSKTRCDFKFEDGAYCGSVEFTRCGDYNVCLYCGTVHRIAISNIVEDRITHVSYLGAACRIMK